MRVDNPSDSEVMRLVQAGDTLSLAVLFERYHAPLFRYLLHLTGNRALSEDLVQEVFVRVLKYARSFHGEQDHDKAFAVWLYRMARNAQVDAMRNRRGEVADDGMGELRSAEPMPEELFSKKQDLAFLETALRKLPEDKREVLVLSRYQNLRYEEIASVLACEVGAVKVRAYRALKQLREIFCELRGERVL